MTPELRTAINERLKEFESELDPLARKMGMVALEHEGDFRTILTFLHFGMDAAPCKYCKRIGVHEREPACRVREAYNRIFAAYP